MVSFKVLQDPVVKDRWDVAKYPTYSGLIEVRGLASACRNSESSNVRLAVTAVDDIWKFSFTIRAGDYPESIGLFMYHLRKSSTCTACFVVTLNSKTAVIAGERAGLHEYLKRTTDRGPGWGIPRFCQIDRILNVNDLMSEDIATLGYSIWEYPPQSSLPMDLRSPAISLLNILANMLDDESSSDVCLVVVHPHATRRRPERLHANSKILAGRSEYFKTLFKSEFSEGLVSDTPAGDVSESGKWEEDSDSDYDADEDESENDKAERTTEIDADTITLVSSHTEAQQKVVHIRDTSYRTYRTLLFFLYTGSVAFAPLKSTYRVEKLAHQRLNTNESFKSREEYNDKHAKVISTLRNENVPWASAKSMYKICDRLDIADLKKAACEYIKQSLTSANVMDELSSSFSSRYPVIRAMEEEYLKDHWDEVCQTPTFDRHVGQMLGNYPDGVADVMLRLFRNLTIKAPENSAEKSKSQ